MIACCAQLSWKPFKSPVGGGTCSNFSRANTYVSRKYYVHSWPRSGSVSIVLDVDDDDDDDDTSITQSLPEHHCRMSRITRHADSPKSLRK